MLYTLAKVGKKQETVLKLPVCIQLGIALPFLLLGWKNNSVWTNGLPVFLPCDFASQLSPCFSTAMHPRIVPSSNQQFQP